MSNTYSKMVFSLRKIIDYQDGAIVSKTIVDNENSSLILYALDANQKISGSTVHEDTVVQSIEGEVFVKIGQSEFLVREGEMILVSQDDSYSLRADERTKFILYVA